MEPFVCQDCFECCKNAVVTPKELVRIRRYLRSLPKDELIRLKGQPRGSEVCPLVDIENKRCAVYDLRPDICHRFGYSERMQCSYNTHIPLKPYGEWMAEFIETNGIVEGDDATLEYGVLGRDITWAEGLVKV